MNKVNSENFQDKISQTEKSLVYISAPWCGPCKQLSPIVEEVSSDIGDKIMIGKMDADENMEFIKNLNVRNIPTILYYKDGELKDRTVGLKTKSEILKMIESL